MYGRRGDALVAIRDVARAVTWISHHSTFPLRSSSSSPPVTNLFLYACVLLTQRSFAPAWAAIRTWTVWMEEMGQEGGRSSCWDDPLRSGFLLRPARHCLQPCIRTVRCASEHPLERPIHAYMSPRVQCRLKWAGWLYRRNTDRWRAVSSYAYLFPILIPLRSTFYLRLAFHFSFRASGFSFSL